MSNTKTNHLGTIVAFVVSLLFVAAAVWLFLNRQYALDQLSVWSYHPSSAVQSIEQQVGFTNKGKFVFYATKPEVESSTTFNSECPRQEVGNPILGCYTTGDRIYVYNVANKELDGMEEVTAAHETLHAVWARTSQADKDKLTAELQAAYDKLDDSELKTRMDYYQRTEPGQFINELHSILGTEVSSLGEPLESYYNQFFSREKVLALHEKYSNVYTALYNQSDQLYSKMQTLATTIQSATTTYQAAASQLSADINSFNSRAKSGSFSSQSQFSSERAALVARSNSLEAERQSINNDIATYDGYYDQYQTISKQIQVLNDSIDSFKQVDQAPSV